MTTTASIEILTPVIDLSDDDDDDDIDQSDIECRYSVTRRSGLLFIHCMSKNIQECYGSSPLMHAYQLSA